MNNIINTRFHTFGGIRRFGLLTTTAVAALSGLYGGAASAQTSDTATVNEVVVTGSRIQNANFNAPTPVTVVGSEVIQKSGISQVADALALLPAQSNSVTALLTSAQVFNPGVSDANLRGLGATRTLVLVDSKRFMASTVGTANGSPPGAVDLNLIPASLIQRIDVVTGGASASYGSDAVSGVVNVILNHNLTGWRAQLQYQESKYGDYVERMASLAHGFGFAGGRGHVVVAGEYVDNMGIANCQAAGRRSFCSPGALVAQTQQAFLVGNPTPGVNGMPASVVFAPGVDYTKFIPNARLPPYAIGGIVPSGPLAGTKFDPQSNPFAYTPGAPENPTSGVPMAGSVMHYSIYGRASYEFTKALRGTLDVSYGFANAVQAAVPPRWQGAPATTNTLTIRSDNAYLTPATRALMTARGATTFPLNFFGDNFGYATAHIDRDSFRIVPGLEGDLKLFGRNWSWNIYDQYSVAKYKNRTYSSFLNDNVNLSADAVVVTAANVGSSGLPIGSIACRSRLTANNGCVPVNYMGVIAPTAAQLAYISGTLQGDIKTTQNVVAANASGELFDLPAGPLSIAVGAEYRQDKVSTVVDPLTRASAWNVVALSEANGTLKVKEGYAEIQAPLLKDLPLIQSLSTQLAGRMTDYSTSGLVKTWKAGFTNDVNGWLRLRATWSRDIRAPNLWELFATRILQNGNVNDPVTNRTNLPVFLWGGGNPNLKPEVAKTFTAGLVFTGQSSSLFEGLHLSVDYFDINIRNAIANGPGAQNTVTQCFAGFTSTCGLIQRDAAGNILSIENAFVNLNNQTQAGYDIVVDYRKPAFGGQMAFTLNATRTTEAALVSGSTGVRQSNVGVQGILAGIGGQRKWVADASVGYSADKYSVTLRARYFSPGRVSATQVGPEQADYSPSRFDSTNKNFIPDVTYFYLNGSIRPWSNGRAAGIEFYGAINNLLDKKPPFAANQFFQIYDSIGRLYRAGVRWKL